MEAVVGSLATVARSSWRDTGEYSRRTLGERATH